MISRLGLNHLVADGLVGLNCVKAEPLTHLVIPSMRNLESVRIWSFWMELALAVSMARIAACWKIQCYNRVNQIFTVAD